MSDLTREDRDRLRALAENATPGPWKAEYSEEQGNCVLPPDARSTREAVAVTRLYHQQADADFIAAARTAIPALLDALDAAEAHIESVRAMLDHYSESDHSYECRMDGDCDLCVADEVLGALDGER